MHGPATMDKRDEELLELKQKLIDLMKENNEMKELILFLDDERNYARQFVRDFNNKQSLNWNSLKQKLGYLEQKQFELIRENYSLKQVFIFCQIICCTVLIKVLELAVRTLGRELQFFTVDATPSGIGEQWFPGEWQVGQRGLPVHSTTGERVAHSRLQRLPTEASFRSTQTQLCPRNGAWF